MPDHDAAFAAVRAAMLAAYAGTLASTQMSPIEALECMAAALGSIYREVADAHIDAKGCRCGWVPSERRDRVALDQAIAANAARDDGSDFFDLRALIPVGHG